MYFFILLKHFLFKVFNQRLNENKTEKGLSSRSTCDKYRTPFLRWMASEWDKAKQQFPSNVCF